MERKSMGLLGRLALMAPFMAGAQTLTAQAGNYSIPAGSGTLTYTETVSSGSTCPLNMPPTTYATVTTTTFSSFVYNGQALSGSIAYLSVSGSSSYCPSSGWQGPIPLPLSGPGLTVFFTPSLYGGGSAVTNALMVSASPTSSVFGGAVSLNATEQYPNASGTVTFMDGATTLGTATMSNRYASFTVSSFVAGTHSISASYAGNSPAATSAAISYSVAQAPQSISFSPPSSQTYGASPVTLSATGGLSGNSVTFSVTSGPGIISGNTLSITGAGTIYIAANQAGNANYAAAQVTQSVVVNPATITVTANSASRLYGATNPSLTGSYSGFVNGQTTSVLSGNPTLTTAAAQLSPVGSYAITATGGTLSAPNYTFAFVNGTLTVNKAALTVSAKSASRTYGAANPPLTPSYSGFVNGETSTVLLGAPSLITSATAGSPVGTYAIAASLGTLGPSNYTFGFVNGTLTVTPAPLTIIANNASRSYGTANPALTVTYSGLVNGDAPGSLSGNPSLSTTATGSSAPGSYPINVASGTLTSANYSISYINGTLSVAQAVPVITWPPPASILAGNALSSLQLNAVANVAGTFAYRPATGALLTAGTQALSVIFTPTDTTNYANTTKTNTLTVLSGTVSDGGTVTLKVDSGSGLQDAASTTYSAGSTPESVALGLANGIKPGSPVSIRSAEDQIFVESSASGKNTNYPFVLETTAWDSTDFPQQPSFAYPAVSGWLEGGSDASTATHTVYSFHINYDFANNVIGYSDSIAGTVSDWGFTYDSLNRLAGGSTDQPGNSTPNYCWSYDSFGNRQQQVSSTIAFTAQVGGSAACPLQGSFINNSAAYGSDNRVSSTTARGVASVPNTDAAGNIQADGANWYLYDGEGRVCAVASRMAGSVSMMGYVYDAEGRRVSKGVINAWTCDATANGYQPIVDYVLGSNAEALTEVGIGSGNAQTWQRTYVYGDDKLIATFDPAGLHFRATDWVGSLRVSTDYAGVVDRTCTGLPFGETANCSSTVDQRLFTGKERDAESGNDYFGARFYSSAMARFVSPDWNAKAEPIPYAKLDDPQSLNLYSYGRNNPLMFQDPDGHASIWWERIKAVRLAWEQEKQLVQRTGSGTAPWTAAQKEELLTRGRVSGYVGHHINSVKAAPEMAGNPDNIKFVPREEHLAEHGGNFRNATSGELLARSSDVVGVLAAADAGIQIWGAERSSQFTGVFEHWWGELKITDAAKAAVTFDGQLVTLSSQTGSLGFGDEKEDVFSVHDGAFWQGDRKMDAKDIEGQTVSPPPPMI